MSAGDSKWQNGKIERSREREETERQTDREHISDRLADGWAEIEEAGVSHTQDNIFKQKQYILFIL